MSSLVDVVKIVFAIECCMFFDCASLYICTSLLEMKSFIHPKQKCLDWRNFLISIFLR